MAREESVTTKELGIAVIGSGRIGTLRARLAAKHPAVRFVAVSDKDPANAKKLADLAGAHVHSADNDEIIAHPDVNAVFVSTPEGEHAAAVCKALELGKAVLVEKPLALSLNDAEAIINTLKRTGGTLRVGYSRRFKECFLRAKEQMVHGRLGRISGGLARVYNSDAGTILGRRSPVLVKKRPVDALDQQPAVHVGLEAISDLDGLARGDFRIDVWARLNVLVHRRVLTLWKLIPDSHNNARVRSIVRFFLHARNSCFGADDGRRAEMIKPSVYPLL